ncbi:Hypothetical predicted protein, partial [Pelobates cultripes]
ILTNDKLCPFKQLQAKHNIPDSLCFSYLQIQSWLRKQKPPPALEPLTPPQQERHLSILEALCTQGKPPSKPVSFLYHDIIHKLNSAKPKFTLVWELDFQQELDEQQWSKIFKANRKLTLCTTHIEVSRKVLYQWHLVPTSLQRFNPHKSDLCWRCQAYPGMVYHVWWTCAKIIPFWTQISNLIRDITQIDLPMQPERYLLHLLPLGIPKSAQYLMYHVLISALQAISKNWLSSHPLTLASCIKAIETTRKYKIMARKAGPQAHLGETAWNSWNIFYSRVEK